MVIICPRCEARYRLDDGRMQGRGARVVCPRCQHVFVVLRDATATSAEPEPDSPTSEPSMPAIGVISRHTPGPIRVVTPGPRKQRKEVATIEVEAVRPEDVREAEEPAAEPPVAEELVADELDFREVGIRTWKVRASIGITYDFSDLATLKRYLVQKRVGPDDELSSDGSGWIRLGDIEDLDAWFINAWKRARAALPARAEPAATVVDSGISEPPPAAPASRATSRRAGSSSPRLTPVAERRSGTWPPVPQPKRRDPNRQLLWAVAAVLLVAGWLLALSHTRPTQGEPPDEQQVEAVDPKDAGLADGDEQDSASTPDDAPDATPEPTPEPVVAAPTPRPGRLRPPSQREHAAPGPAPDAEKLAAGETWYRGGLRAMEEADYGKARDMFARAVKKAGGEPRYWDALGDAQVRLGDTEGAARSYSNAEELGHAKVGR